MSLYIWYIETFPTQALRVTVFHLIENENIQVRGKSEI